MSEERIDLPVRDIEPDRRERIRARAHDIVQGREPRWRRVYDQYVEPAWVLGTAVVYLVWAFSAAGALYLQV